MPNGVVTHLETRLLKDMVNNAIHPIRCATSCKQKFMKGMRIGDLCAETGHFWWAMRVWELTERLIANKDWDDWRYVWFDNNRVRLRDVISETECELLSKRRSDLWRALGFPEYAWWTAEWEHIASDTFGSHYTALWLDKFDFDPVSWTEEWESAMREIRDDQGTEVLFREGKGDFLCLCMHKISSTIGAMPHKQKTSHSLISKQITAVEVLPFFVPISYGYPMLTGF